MSDKATLEDRLTRLAASGFGQGTERTLRAADPRNLLRGILSEADTIVMPRELRVRGDAGSGLVFEVANRRLLKVRPLGSGPEPVILDPADPETIEAANGMIDGAMSGSKSARIAHWPLEREIDPAEPGTSIQVLADHWNVVLGAHGDAEGDAIDRFLSGVSDALPAWIMLSEDVSESFGDEAMITWLEPLVEGDLVRSLQDGTAVEPWRFNAIGPASPDAAIRAVAATGGTVFIMVVSPGRLGEVADIWRDVVG